MYQLKDCKTINFAVWPTKKATFDRGRVSLKNTSSKIDPRDFRREIIPFPLRFAKYLSFCADVNSKTLLVSEGLKNLVTSIKEQIYFEFQASKAENERKVVIHPGFLPFFLPVQTPLFISKMTDELKYQLFLFTVPMIMSFILIGIAVKIYRKCKDSKYTAFPVADKTDDI